VTVADRTQKTAAASANNAVARSKREPRSILLKLVPSRRHYGRQISGPVMRAGRSVGVRKRSYDNEVQPSHGAHG
jgi:hypothetical protein